jgi:hypothetical protein
MISVRVGTKVPTQVGVVFADTDIPLCATFNGPPNVNTTENVDFVCPNNTQGSVVVVQKRGKMMMIKEIRVVYEPIKRKF